MKTQFNITSMKWDLERYTSVEDFATALEGFDGVELMDYGDDISPIIPEEKVIGIHMRCCKIFHRRITLQIPFHTCYIKLCFHPLPILPYLRDALAFFVFKDCFSLFRFFLCLQQFPDQTILRTRLFQITLPQLLSGQFHLCV